ncbi:flagellar hook-length control protein FliK [Pseudomonas sp. RIT-PI-AD]|uniref:flagellar hook-length control protein FliK n=1 Tax=Pseudomonas sp. RIT-PI-AD TaxID=3035294 RepID=UPI0021D83AA9|nr:flagellar hook-length control protein FliK [Pseudomonas sp. RIT-PI-AD]
MSEISSPRAIPPSPPPARIGAGTDLALKLLQPLEGLLAPGQSANAEVIAVEEGAQSFQVLLKLTLDNGREATVQADSARPLPPGTALSVTALSETRLAMALLPGSEQPLESLDLDQIPVGTLLQGKVVGSQQILQEQTQQTLFRLVAKLLDGPLAGQRIALDSPQALPLGSLLTAQVRDAQSLLFMPLTSQLDQLEVSQQLAGQQSRQGSLDTLVKALQGLGGADLPDDLKASLGDLLDSLPDIHSLGDPGRLSKAMGDSGLLLEAKLLAGQTAALSQDLKANLLRLIAQLLPNLPGAGAALPSSANSAAVFTQALPAFLRNALGALGQNGLRQQGLSFPLPTRLVQAMENEGDLEGLLKLAAAAVSRLQTHQLSSLAQSQVGPDGNLVTTWQLELPMRQQQDVIPLQVKVQREETAQKNEQKDPMWRVELAFDLAPLGPLQVQAQLLRGNISSQMWAERENTARLIDGELPNLRDRLLAAGLSVGELACRQGTPPQGTRTSLEQRWIDETA